MSKTCAFCKEIKPLSCFPVPRKSGKKDYYKQFQVPKCFSCVLVSSYKSSKKENRKEKQKASRKARAEALNTLSLRLSKVEVILKEILKKLN